MIDFRHADVRDINWWRRSNILIQEMEAADDLVASQGLLQFYLAHVSNGSLLEASFKAMGEGAKQELLRVLELLRPWTSAAKSNEQALDELTAKYKAQFGDPNDPAFLATIKEGIRKHEALQRQALFTETEEQRITRLIRDRDLKRSTR